MDKKQSSDAIHDALRVIWKESGLESPGSIKNKIRGITKEKLERRERVFFALADEIIDEPVCFETLA